MAEILAQLPAELEAGIIIVQHVDAAFAPGLGQWLYEQSRRRVTLIAEGHQPAVREVLLSGTDDHLVLGEDRRLHYSVEPESRLLSPVSRRVLRQLGPELAQARRCRALDGHGARRRGGAAQASWPGWRTIAQDESSSVVWGMPKAALEIGAAEQILPLSQIAAAITRLVHIETDDRAKARRDQLRARNRINPLGFEDPETTQIRPAGSLVHECRTCLDPAQGHRPLDR